MKWAEADQRERLALRRVWGMHGVQGRRCDCLKRKVILYEHVPAADPEVPRDRDPAGEAAEEKRKSLRLFRGF